ncbi:MAG: hypothetical protein L6R41_007777, partial [Letrouitia leprolyta]
YRTGGAPAPAATPCATPVRYLCNVCATNCPDMPRLYYAVYRERLNTYAVSIDSRDIGYTVKRLKTLGLGTAMGRISSSSLVQYPFERV